MADISRLPVPAHVAIIMDGNGRWAKERGMPRIMGHRQGVEAVREIVRHAGESGVKFLTLFAFSSENWNRPQGEVHDLLGLLKLFIRRDLASLARSNVRIRIIGEREQLVPDIRHHLEEAEATTRLNSGLTLIIAFNYGARDEISRAMQKIAVQVASGALLPDAITPALIERNLDTAGIPDPDLIIRTSGEERLSNFLLWQAAYSEFIFVQDYWPDFGRAQFDAALAEFSRRERRFGGLNDNLVVAGE